MVMAEVVILSKSISKVMWSNGLIAFSVRNFINLKFLNCIREYDGSYITVAALTGLRPQNHNRTETLRY